MSRFDAGEEPTVQPAVAAFAVTRSLLSAEALGGWLGQVYGLPGPLECVLVRSLTNDVYCLRASGATYFAKVYGYGWRSAPEIGYELDLLAHLAAQDVAVAPAVAGRDGTLIQMLAVPEGDRCLVLFAAVPGAKPRPPFTAALYRGFGQAAARLHQALDGVVSDHPRRALDLPYLLDASLAAIRPHLVDRPSDWAYLAGLAGRLRARLEAFAAQGLDWGACHGDLSLDNVHITDDGHLVFFDFDSGGPGWRAFEFQGIYAAAVQQNSDVWDAFVGGYTMERRVGTIDLAAVPYCVLLYAIWDMGWSADQWARWSGLWRIDSAFFDERIGPAGWWRRWEAEQLAA